MLEREHNLYRNAGVGRIAAICNLTDDISFRAKHIRNLIVKQYCDYMLEYLHYDKVYILGPTINERPVTNAIVKYKDNVVWGNNHHDWWKTLGIDDIFITQMTCSFFGGVMKDCYYRQAINLVEWYDESKRVYVIQDDPLYYINNPVKMINERVFIKKNLKVTNNDYNELDHPIMQKYYAISEKLSEILDNCTIAYCGYDYDVYYDRLMQLKHPTLGIYPSAKKWDTFECYYYQGMNDNLENKLKDFEYNDKKYCCEYHGYTKDTKRVKTTEEFYKGLDNFLLISSDEKFFPTITNFNFHEPMGYYDLLQYIAENSKSTLIIASAVTFDTFVSPRWFDCMLSDTIAFVYTPYDSKKTLVDNEELKSFMYVDTPEQFVERVNMINNDKELYKRIKQLQRKDTYTKFGNYCKPENLVILKQKLF